jgi:hypothetical protein
MVRFSILDKNLSFTENSDKRIEITVKSIDNKKQIYKHESGKMKGKFSFTIENSKFKI